METLVFLINEFYIFKSSGLFILLRAGFLYSGSLAVAETDRSWQEKTDIFHNTKIEVDQSHYNTTKLVFHILTIR